MSANSLVTRKVYNFKSSGTRFSIEKGRSLERQAPPPVGIKTPVSFADKGQNFLTMNTTFAEQIHDNLVNLILTNHGERLAFPDFGANLMELTFEMQNEDGQGEAMDRIAKAVTKYMPYVVLETYKPFTEHFENKDVAKVGIQLTYGIPRLNISKKGLEVLLFAAT